MSPSKSIKNRELASGYPSVVTRIPPEILSEIFIWTEALYREEQGARVTTTYTPVYQLYRVCRTWRGVALDTPELWTCINIRGMRTLRRAEKWLEHARRRLCTVWIRTNSGKFACDVAFGLWAGHLDHLEHLELDFGGQRRTVTWDWPGVHSSLASLTIRCVVLHSSEVLHLLSFNRRLKRLIVDVDSIHPSPRGTTDIEVHPTRLTHLDLTTAYVSHTDQLLKLLRCCPNLMFFQIAEGYIFNPSADNLEPVELPELKAISLPWSELAMDLLPLLITSSLQYTVFGRLDNFTCERMEHDYIDGTLATYSKDLRLRDPLDLPDDNLGFFLQRMPRVENLVVDVSDPFTYLSFPITVLTTPNNDGTFVFPKLRNLTLKNVAHWGGSLSDFKQRYEGVPGANCHLPPPLEAIAIENCLARGGFNNLRRLCKKHGTKFSMWHEEVEFVWDRRLMSKRERKEWDERRHGKRLHFDEEDYGFGEEDGEGGEDTDGEDEVDGHEAEGEDGDGHDEDGGDGEDSDGDDDHEESTYITPK